MAKITIPSENKQFVKPSSGEIFGNLWATHNIDLEANKGKIRLSERTYRVYDNGDDADLEIPVKFIRTDADQTERWWVLTQAAKSSVSDGLLFKTTGTDPLTGWTQDAIASTPTDCVDDMEIYGQANSYDRLVVSRDTDLAMMNNGTWTASWWVGTLSQSALTATNPHPLEQFINLLLVIDGNKVHTIDDSLVVVVDRLKLPKEYQIIWTANDGQRVYFGTKHLRGGQALVFPWNGTSETYDPPIPVGSTFSLAGVVPKDGVLHIINDKGQLMKFNGQAFDVIASLPASEKKLKWEKGYARRELVHPNGMAVIGNEIHILLDASMDGAGGSSTLFEEFRSGIWVFNGVSFYNKYSLGQYNGSTNNDWGSSVMLYPGALVGTDLKYGRFLAGCAVYSDNASTQIKSIIASKVDLSVDNRGYFITPQIQASSVRAFWKRMTLVFKKFENATDRIVVKYRTSVSFAPVIRSDGTITPCAIAWTDTDTFTTITSIPTAAVGDEVEILVGKGAGATAHISVISFSSPTYTIDLDEAIPSASGNAKAIIVKWTKLGAISSQTIAEQLYSIAKRNAWIQFKIELRGTESSPELEKLNIFLIDAGLI